MCKLGDIIVVNKYIGDDGQEIGTHSFIVVDDNNGTIKGLEYTMVASAISSFKSKEHKNRKLSFDENIEITNSDIDEGRTLKKASYIKADKLFYFNKDKLDYYVFARGCIMERKNKVKIPKGFFSIIRPEISTKEALKDVIPVEWIKRKTKKDKYIPKKKNITSLN